MGQETITTPIMLAPLGSWCFYLAANYAIYLLPFARGSTATDYFAPRDTASADTMSYLVYGFGHFALGMLCFFGAPAIVALAYPRYAAEPEDPASLESSEAQEDALGQ